MLMDQSKVGSDPYARIEFYKDRFSGLFLLLIR